MSKFCRNCGKELLDDSKFCDVCGTEIIETSANNINTQNIAVTNNNEIINNMNNQEIKNIEYSYAQKNGIEEEFYNKAEANNEIKKNGSMRIPGWLAFLIIVFVFGIMYSSIKGEINLFNYNPDSNSDSDYMYTQRENTQDIEYQKITVDELMNKLEENAASAKEEYNGKYLEITGKLSVIDSDLKYIGIYSINDIDIIGIHCKLKDYKTKSKVKTLTTGQIITVKGKITDVGEILGYVLEVQEIL